MELTRTAMHACAQGTRRFKMITLAAAPTRYSYEYPSILALRTDDDLVTAALSGDQEAFAELCRRHAQVTRQKIFGIVRHRENAEDALQETSFRAYSNLGKFRLAAEFSTWITAIGVNAAFTVLRKRKSRRELDIEPSGPEEPAQDIADRGPIESAGLRKDKFCSSFKRSFRPFRRRCGRS
jgi:hypothetical protein